MTDIENNVTIGFPDVVERQRKKGRKVAVFPINESDSKMSWEKCVKSYMGNKTVNGGKYS